jgi:hypothetical protein
MPHCVLLAPIGQVKLILQMISDFDYTVLGNFAQAAGKAGVGVLPALAGPDQGTNKTLSYVVPICPHWPSIQDVVGDVQ